MDSKRLWLFIAIITIDKNVIYAEAQSFIGARNDLYVTVSKSKQIFENKQSTCQSVPIGNVGPHIVPSVTLPYSKTSSSISQSCYIEKPIVKKFIAEVTAHTTRYSNPGETYDKVLLLLQQYFTRKDPKHNLYDGTLIHPLVNRRIRNELRSNVRITGLLFQNDIALTLSQIKIINALNEYRGKRKIISDPSYHWKSHLIAYRFGNNDRYWQEYIRKALRYWEQETCLRFVENKHDNDYLFFIIGSGCYSSVGRLGGSQTISIGYGCETLGIISHELGHALGFWHEQVRPDRDKYVQINLHNAISGTEGNFEKLRPSQLFDMGVPYDLGSVMHYSANVYIHKTILDFTVDPIDVKYRSTIGNRVKPSFTDFKQINLFYCSDRCRITNLRCLHGGYPDPNNCNICKCPEGLGGRECSDLQYSSCGYEKLATNEWQTLEYTGSSNCYWKIYSPNSRIRFELTVVRYKCDPSCEEYVEVKHKIDFQISGFRSCCLPIQGEILSDDKMIIIISRASRHQPIVTSEGLTSISKTIRQTNNNVIRRCRCRIIRKNCNYRGFYNCKMTTYPINDRSELNSFRFSRRSIYRRSSVKPSDSRRSYNYYRYGRRLKR